MSIIEASPTIGETEALVRRYKEPLTDQFREMARVVGQARVEVPRGLFGHESQPLRVGIPHGNIMSAIGYTRAALLRTHSRFEMVTGSDRILHTLEEEFRLMLQRLLQEGGNARIIVVGEPGKFRQLAQECPQALRVEQGASDKPVAHFFTSDEGVCRVEQPHPPLEDAMDAAGLPAVYYPNTSGRTQGERGVFNLYWERLTGEKQEQSRRRWWLFGGMKNQA
ncbi:MAG: hypothetical protein WCV62_04280 [Candidatus Peribacteraceae bacterium]|jgi:hypothetical protein